MATYRIPTTEEICAYSLANQSPFLMSVTKFKETYAHQSILAYGVEKASWNDKNHSFLKVLVLLGVDDFVCKHLFTTRGITQTFMNTEDPEQETILETKLHDCA